MVILAALGAWTDLRQRRIPNWLTASGLVAGFCLHAGLEGWQGLSAAALGAGLALLVYVPLFALRAIGAGDVKLMAAVGALSGVSNWLLIFVLTSLFAGIWAVLLVASRRSLVRSVLNALHILSDTAQGRKPWLNRPELDIGHPSAVSVPQGAAIALGTFVFLLFG